MSGDVSAVPIDSAVAPQPEHADACSMVLGLDASAPAIINLISTTEEQPAAHGSRTSSPAPVPARPLSGLSMSSTQQNTTIQQMHEASGRTEDSASAELMQYMCWRSLQQQQTPSQHCCLQTQQVMSSPSSIRSTSSQPAFARELQEDHGQRVHTHVAACRTDGNPASPFSPSIADIQQQLQELQALSDMLAAKIAQAGPSAAQDPLTAQKRSAQAMHLQAPGVQHGGETIPAAAGTNSTAAGKVHKPHATNQQAPNTWPDSITAGTPADVTSHALSTAALSTGHQHLSPCSSAQASCGQLHALAPANDSSTFKPAGQGQQLPQDTQALHAATPLAAAAAIQAPAWPASDLMLPAQMVTTHQGLPACANAVTATVAGTIHSSSTVPPTGMPGASMLGSGQRSYQHLPADSAPTAGSAGASNACHHSSASSLPGAFMQAIKNAAQGLINPACLQESVVAAAHPNEHPAEAPRAGGVITTHTAVGAPSYQPSSQSDIQPSAPCMQQQTDGAQGQQQQNWQLRQQLLDASMQAQQQQQQQTLLSGPFGVPAATHAPAQHSRAFGPALGMWGSQQQLEYMLGLQQLQMMQLQLQMQAVAGVPGGGPAFNPAMAAALPTALQLPVGVYGLPLASAWAASHGPAAQQQLGALQLQQQLLSEQQAAVASAQGGLSGPCSGVATGNSPAGSWAGTAPTGSLMTGHVADPTAVFAHLDSSAGNGSAAPLGAASIASAGFALAVEPGPAVPRISNTGGAAPAPSLAGQALSTGSFAALEPVDGSAHDFSRTGISTWLSQWMPLRSHRSSSTPAALSATPSSGAWDQQVLLADGLPAGSLSLAPLLQLALYPVTRPLTATVDASSTMMQLLWSLGQSAVSASAWTARSAALACVTLSQYQLLALLCCLAAAATAAQLVAAAAAAAVDTGRTTLQLADRERRLFARAAALVAFTDMKQLCMLLATQPLLLMRDRLGAVLGPYSSTQLSAQATLDAAAQPQTASSSAAGTDLSAIIECSQLSTQQQALAGENCDSSGASRSSSVCAPPPWRLSRSLSGMLGGVLGTPGARQCLTGSMRAGSMQPLRQSFTGPSRRCSGPAVPVESSMRASPAPCDATTVAGVNKETQGFDSLSQEIAVYSSAMSVMGPVPQRPSAAAGSAGSSGVPGVPASLLVVYDSLAVVSGLWAGMWLRVCLLLGLQAPLAGCRMWLHAFSTWVHMSAAAAAASTRTVMQLAWVLGQLSLVILGTASAQHARSAQGDVTRKSHQGWFLQVGGPAAATALAVLQWVWQQCYLVIARQVGVCWHLAGSSLAAVPGGGVLTQHGAVISTYASAVFAALAAAFSSTCAWLQSVRSQTGLFSKGGMQAMAGQAMQLAMLLMAWLLTRVWIVAEAVAGMAAEWLLRDVSPVGRAAVYGSAKMIKGLVVEAGRQSDMLAQQLCEAWRAHHD